MSDKPPQGPVNHLAMLPAFLKIGTVSTKRAVTSPFVRKKEGGARTYQRDVLYTALREVLASFNVHEGQYLQPGTNRVYKSVAKSEKWKANSVDLGDGAKGHWLGHTDAKYVLIYFHGGGYISPASPGHMKYQFALQKHLRQQGIDISVFSLAYILAPHALYPDHLKSAVASLKYLINDTSRDPSTILLGGDSAGGNLVAELLLHLGHPHPQVEQLSLERRLKGAVLISPWVSFDYTTPSMSENALSDYLSRPALERASAAFIGADTDSSKTHDEYSEPIKAPVEWWREVAENAVEDVLIWGGGGEVLIDGIRAFASNVINGFSASAAKGGQATATALGTDSVHSQNNVTAQVGENGASMSNPAAMANAATNAQTNGEEKTALPPMTSQRAKFIESPHEAHEEMIIDRLLFIRGHDDGETQIKKWLENVLGAGAAVGEKEAEQVKESGRKSTEGMLAEVNGTQPAASEDTKDHGANGTANGSAHPPTTAAAAVPEAKAAPVANGNGKAAAPENPFSDAKVVTV